MFYSYVSPVLPPCLCPASLPMSFLHVSPLSLSCLSHLSFSCLSPPLSLMSLPTSLSLMSHPVSLPYLSSLCLFPKRDERETEQRETGERDEGERQRRGTRKRDNGKRQGKDTRERQKSCHEFHYNYLYTLFTFCGRVPAVRSFS